MQVVIIGAGAIGQALGKIIKEKRGSTVVFWDAAPGKVKRQLPLNASLAAADFVFLCLPSFVLREAVKLIRPHLRRRTIVVAVSKGIEANTNLTVDRLLAKILPFRQPFVLLFGPMLAAELALGSCGHAVAASASRASLPKIAALFSGTRLRLKKSYDLRGVALCGALKNVYAIGLGIVAALEAGDNVRGAYIAAAANEMRAIVRLLGGQAETVNGYAGLADLVATGLSANSRNRQVGCALGSRGRCQGSEGSRAAVSIADLLGGKHRRFPVFHALVRILGSGAEPEAVLAAVCAS